MNRALLAVVVLSFSVVGCATNVDEPVEQIPEPPQREQAPQTFSGDLRIGLTDPVMQAIVDQNNSGLGNVPPKQVAYSLPGK